MAKVLIFWFKKRPRLVFLMVCLLVQPAFAGKAKRGPVAEQDWLTQWRESAGPVSPDSLLGCFDHALDSLCFTLNKVCESKAEKQFKQCVGQSVHVTKDCQNVPELGFLEQVNWLTRHCRAVDDYTNCIDLHQQLLEICEP